MLDSHGDYSLFRLGSYGHFSRRSQIPPVTGDRCVSKNCANLSEVGNLPLQAVRYR